jgi:hypothetical protein
LLRSNAASRIGSGVALLGECQRRGSKRYSDCEDQTFHGALHYQIDGTLAQEIGSQSLRANDATLAQRHSSNPTTKFSPSVAK